MFKFEKTGVVQFQLSRVKNQSIAKPAKKLRGEVIYCTVCEIESDIARPQEETNNARRTICRGSLHCFSPTRQDTEVMYQRMRNAYVSNRLTQRDAWSWSPPSWTARNWIPNSLSCAIINASQCHFLQITDAHCSNVCVNYLRALSLTKRISVTAIWPSTHISGSNSISNTHLLALHSLQYPNEQYTHAKHDDIIC